MRNRGGKVGVMSKHSDTPTACQIIARWPSVAALAEDIGVPRHIVYRWRLRDSIAAEHDVALVAAAKRRGVYLTFEDLAHSRSVPYEAPRATKSPARGQAAEVFSRTPAANQSPD